MKRKLIKRNKDKYSRLVKFAAKHELELYYMLQVLSSVREMKQSKRIGNRHGIVESWEKIEISSAMISVPIMSRKNRRLLHHDTYLSAEMLPTDIRALWVEMIRFFSNDSDLIAEWLNTPIPALGNKPKYLLGTSFSRQQVKLCLEAMKFGDFA